MLSLYVGRVAKWAMPDRVIFAERLPVGATGKVLKNKLRELCGKSKLPTALSRATD